MRRTYYQSFVEAIGNVWSHCIRVGVFNVVGGGEKVRGPLGVL